MSKILLMGDLHLTDSKPTRRKDKDYLQTMKNKFGWVRELYSKENCSYMLQAGDFFNSHKASIRTIVEAIHMLGAMEVYCVYGQHDMYYHSKDLTNTPLKILETCGVITPVYSLEIVHGKNIHGAFWGEEIDKDGIDILVVHSMVINEEKLWADQEDFVYAKTLLDSTNYDLILSGDNHQNFVVEHKGKLLVNPGSFMRSNISQVNHKPTVYIYDLNTERLDAHEVPISPANEVFDTDEYEKETERTDKIKAFVEGLASEKEINGLDFTANIKTLLTNKKIEKSIKIIIEEILCQIT